MDKYYLNENAQSTGEREVHISTCSWLPKEENRIYLGYFYTCQEAIRKAKELYDDVDGCYYCIPECHTK